MKPCKHCCSSGNYVGMPIYNGPSFTGGPPPVTIPIQPCKYCNGKGWIDEDEPIKVPRKYINDDYFNNPLCNNVVINTNIVINYEHES
jgi:hypothetical protein